MQIVYLNFDRGIPVLGGKGGSVHVRSVVTALTRLGHEVTVLCSQAGDGNAPPPGRLVTLAPDPGQRAAMAECEHLRLPMSALEDKLTYRELGVLAHDRALPARAVAALADQGVRPDLIYERHALFHVAGMAIARVFDVPRVLEVNAPLTEEQARFRGLALHDIAAEREAKSWLGASLAVAVSEDIAMRLRAVGVPNSRILVGQNGVDTALFRLGESHGAEVRRSLLLGDHPVVGFVGSFKAWHGVDFLIDAVARLRAEWPELRLLALGDGPLRAAAEARAAALLGDAAVFTGSVPHEAVPAHLAAMDLTVAPYMPREGFYFSPLKVIESLAAGRPVVAPRIGQIEHLVDDRVTGLLYPPGNLDACVAAIAELLAAPALRRRFGAEAAQRARAGWDWTALVSRVLDRAVGAPALQQAAG